MSKKDEKKSQLKNEWNNLDLTIKRLDICNTLKDIICPVDNVPLFNNTWLIKNILKIDPKELTNP
jgi:hypothetical protein